MGYSHTIGGERYQFPSLARLLAKASPARSGDELAGIAAACAKERIAAQLALADLPLKRLIEEPVIAYASDEITRLIVDSHDAEAFEAIAHLTVGELRDFLLSDEATSEVIASLKMAFTPEMIAAVSKIMRVQDLVLVARKVRVVTRFRTTVGLPGRLSTRLQPNHPTDDPRGIAASMIDGLMLGSGDAVIGINPVSDSPQSVVSLLRLIEAGTAAVWDSNAGLCVSACDDADGGDAAGRSAGFAVSVSGWDGGDEQELRGFAGVARRGA